MRSVILLSVSLCLSMMLHATVEKTVDESARGRLENISNIEESPHLTLSFCRTTVAASPNSVAIVEVKSDITWTATSDQPWLMVSGGSTGNGTLTLTASANPSVITRAATVTVSGPGVASQTIKITQAGLIRLVTSVPVITTSKVYDGTTSAIVSAGVLSGVAEADAADVRLIASATYDNAKAGAGKTITVKYNLVGSATSEYAVPLDYVVTGEILPKELTVTGIAVSDKVYDGNALAQITGSRLEGLISSDVVTLVYDGIGTFNQKDKGENIAVKLRPMTIAGADAGNYKLVQPDAPTASIIARTLTVSGAVAQDKIYDGNAIAQISGSKLEGVIAPDDVSLVAQTNGTFAQADKGNNIPVTISPMKLTGADSGNYTLVQPSGLSATISAKSLTVSGAVALDKTYDGNNIAQITGATLDGVISPDVVTLANYRTGIFAQKDKGVHIAVSTLPMTITGADAGNYTLVQPGELSAGITPKPLTVRDAVAQDKVYDGNTVAQITGATLGGVVSPDVVTLAGTGAFLQKDVGAKIKVTGLFVSGKDTANYVLIQPENLAADITPVTLTVSGAVAKDKIYDGNATAQITGASLTGVVPSDVVSLSGTGIFSQKGVGEQIGVTNLLITGKDAGNYILAQPGGLTADITAKPLTVTGTFAQNKVYDGNVMAHIGGSKLEGVVSSDDVTLVGQTTGTFARADKGINIPVSILPMTITGSDSENYTLLQPGSLSADIVAKQLTIEAPTVVTHKMADGNTTAAITTIGSLNGVEAADVNNISVSATASYDNANIGNNKTITVVYALGGNAMTNYIAPADYKLSGARISDYVTLAPITTPTAGCGGYDLDLAYTVLTGSPTQYKITFDQTAISAGLQNVSYTDLPSSDNTGALTLAIPSGMPDGTYSATLQMRNEFGAETQSYAFRFTINLSSDYIIPKFDDMLICDNSSNRFTAYQWYKNGRPIEGASRQFYTDNEGLEGTYSLRVTTTDGQELFTCSKTLNIPLNSIKQVSVYPNPLKLSTQNSTVEISGFSDKELQGAIMTVYDIKGIPVYTTGNLTRFNKLILPHVAGLYVGKISFAGDKEHEFKVIVTE